MNKYAPTIAFILYLILAIFALFHHEPWGDEIHSWNIAKGSSTYLDVIHNSRFEGHPPTWYTIMWTISKFTHHYTAVQIVHLIIASLTVFIILFYSPLPLVARLLIPFGYFFLFEFAVLSRNYAIGLLLAFCLCLLIRQTFRYKILVYYLLFFVLSNSHLFALILAGSFHLYFMVWDYEQHKNKRRIALHALISALLLVPSLYCIFPPSHGSLSTNYWLNRWDVSNVFITAQAPIQSFIPIPAWWTDHFWNTQFLMEWQGQHRWLKYITPFLSLALLAIIFAVLRRNRKALLLFTANLLVTALISIVVFPVGCTRYTGLIFVGFLAAWWLYSKEVVPSRRQTRVVAGLLALQIIGAIIAIGKDNALPFSNFNKAGELLAEVPTGEKAVSDYWALNAVAAFTDKPMYCLDLKKETSFLLWDADMARLMETKYRYCDGAAQLFSQGINRFYMISSGSLANIAKVDERFAKIYNITLVDQREGAIEKGSNMYLYEITR